MFFKGPRLFVQYHHKPDYHWDLSLDGDLLSLQTLAKAE